MVITVECPSCATSFPVDPSKIPEGGVNARCSSCGHVFRVEKPAPEPAEVIEVEAAGAPDDWVIETEDETGLGDIEIEPMGTVEQVVDEARDEAGDFTMADAEPTAFEGGLDESAFFEGAPSEAPPDDSSFFAGTEEPEAPAAVESPEPEPLAMPDESSFFESPTPEVEAEPDTSAEVAEGPVGFTFGRRDPTDKARRLARVLVSDMVMYHADRHQNALANGTLQEDFEEEIDKSWKEYVEQVGPEMAEGEGQQFWRDALNEVLAKGEQLF